MFLPLGAKYSIDNALNTSDKIFSSVYFSLSSIAIYIQIISVYLFTSFALKQDVKWLGGEAILSLATSVQDGTPLSTYLATHLPISYLKLITHSVRWLALLSPLFLLPLIFTSQVRLFSIGVYTLLNLCLIVFFDSGFLPWVNIAALFILLPERFWDSFTKKLKTPVEAFRETPLQIKIYFDGMCGFCKKMVLIIRTFFLIPETQILPAQDDLKVYEVMQKENSWVVMDHTGKLHTKYTAFLILCENSPVLYYLLPFFRFGPIVQYGTMIYEKIASNRFLGSRIISSLKFRKINIEKNDCEKIFIVIFMIFIIFSNVENIYGKYKIPDNLKSLGTLLNIEQPWYKSAPISTKDRNIKWYLVQGIFNDGKEYNLLRYKEKISWRKPDFLSTYYKNRFWKNYFEDSLNISLYPGYDINAFNYTAYACKNWNKSEKQKSKLEFVKVFLVNEDVSSEYGINKTLKWEQNCSAIKL